MLCLQVAYCAQTWQPEGWISQCQLDHAVGLGSGSGFNPHTLILCLQVACCAQTWQPEGRCQLDRAGGSGSGQTCNPHALVLCLQVAYCAQTWQPEGWISQCQLDHAVGLGSGSGFNPHTLILCLQVACCAQTWQPEGRCQLDRAGGSGSGQTCNPHALVLYLQVACCAQMWPPEGWTSPMSTGSCSMTPPRTPPPLCTGWGVPPAWAVPGRPWSCLCPMKSRMFNFYTCARYLPAQAVILGAHLHAVVSIFFQKPSTFFCTWYCVSWTPGCTGSPHAHAR